MHEIVNTGHVGTIENYLGGWLPYGDKGNLMHKAFRTVPYTTEALYKCYLFLL